MDVVSDAISAVRLGHPRFRRVRTSGSWCVRLAPYDGAGFHVVVKGGCWLLTDGGARMSLGVGDAVLLPHGAGHVIADSPVDASVAGGRRSRSSSGLRRRGREADLVARKWRCSAASTGSTAAACTR
ncbi:cupin domain-containing protein [Actinomadura keratinilytica]|uniref:cupin domain-containing protein n=1 Tax=Actinomadura keratinilytica TaxID=547461 RepID=UPI00361FD73F